MRRFRRWLVQWLCGDLLDRMAQAEREIRVLQSALRVRRSVPVSMAKAPSNGERLFSRSLRQYAEDRRAMP